MNDYLVPVGHRGARWLSCGWDSCGQSVRVDNPAERNICVWRQRCTQSRQRDDCQEAIYTLDEILRSFISTGWGSLAFGCLLEVRSLCVQFEIKQEHHQVSPALFLSLQPSYETALFLLLLPYGEGSEELSNLPKVVELTTGQDEL